MFLAYAYLSQGRAGEVLSLAERTPSSSLPEPLRNSYQLYTAEALWNLDRREEAVSQYNELLGAEDPVAAAAYRRLFMAVEPEGDLTQMQSLMQKAESRFAGQPAVLLDLWVQIGVESVRQGKLQLGDYFLGKVWEPAGPGLPAGRGAALPGRAEAAPRRAGRGRRAARAVPVAEAVPDRPGPAAPGGGAPAAGAVRGGGGAVPALPLPNTPMRRKRRKPAIAWPTPATAWASWMRPCRWPRASRQRSRRARCARTCTDCWWQSTASAARPGRPPRCWPSTWRSNPADVRARLDLLRLYFTLREYPALVNETSRLLEPGLKDSDPYAFLLAGYLRGMAETGRKRYGEALVALEPVTREAAEKAGLDAVYPYGLYYQAWAQYKLNQLKPAREKAAAMTRPSPATRCSTTRCSWPAGVPTRWRTTSRAASYFARLSKVEGETGTKALFLQGKSLASLGRLAGGGPAVPRPVHAAAQGRLRRRRPVRVRGPAGGGWTERRGRRGLP